MRSFKKRGLLIFGVVAVSGLLPLLWWNAETETPISPPSEAEAVSASRHAKAGFSRPVAGVALPDPAVDSERWGPDGAASAAGSEPSFKRDVTVVAGSGSLVVGGFVLDSFSKEPISGAGLSIAAADGEGSAVEVVSGERGRFSLLLPRADRYTLQAEAEGYRRRVRDHLFVDRGVEDLVVELDPLFLVRGVVVNERGQPLPGASVDVKPAADNPLRFVPNSATRTDEKGEFAYAHLPRAGAYEFHAFHVNHTFSAPVAIEVPKLDWVELQMTSIPPEERGMIYGFVFDSEGRSLAAHPIGLDTLSGRISHELLRTESNPDGGFQFGPLAAGRYDVHADVPTEYANTPSRSASVTVSPGGRHRVRLTLEKAESVRGVVLALDSELPVGRVRVVMRNEGSAAGVGFITGPDGEFRGDQLARGTVMIAATHPDFQPLEMRVAIPSRAPVIVRLEGGLSLSGTLGTFQGVPVEAARLSLVSQTRDRTMRSALIQAVDGRFLLRGLARDSYELKIELPDGTVGSAPLMLSESARIAVLIDPRDGRVELHE